MGTVSKLPKPRLRCSFGVGGDTRIKAIYEGASRNPRMGTKGLRGVGGPNGDIQNSLATLRRRSRHAIRNNAYATTAVETYVANLVGNGIVAKWPNAQMQTLWEEWITQCDADGIDNLYGLQMLAARAQFSDGEALARRRIRRPGDGLRVPLQVQLLEGDHLDEAHSQRAAQGDIVMGVEFGTWAQRAGYHLWQYHPGDINLAGLNQRRRVPAEDIIHLYRRLRPGQVRGVPELTPVLIRLYEIDEMQDATLVKQKAAALFGWIVKKKTHDPDLPTELSTIGTPAGESVNSETGETTQLTEIRSGGVHYLDEDEDVTFSDPADIGSNYDSWLKTELRASAKAVGLTYEQLTGDLTGVNYSSIRAGLVEFRRRIEQLQLHLLIHRFCHPIAQWFADMAVISGAVEIPGYWADRFVHLPKWRAPRWDWVDPLKDVMGDLIEVRSGFNTRANKAAERGLDIDEVDGQLEREQGSTLVLDSNPSKTAKTGALQQGLDILNNSED